MLKNDDRSRNVYENKGEDDNTPEKIPDLWSENALVSHKLTQFFGLSGKKIRKLGDNFGRVAEPIGPSLIGPLIHRLSMGLVLVGPIVAVSRDVDENIGY